MRLRLVGMLTMLIAATACSAGGWHSSALWMTGAALAQANQGYGAGQFQQNGNQGMYLPPGGQSMGGPGMYPQGAAARQGYASPGYGYQYAPPPPYPGQPPGQTFGQMTGGSASPSFRGGAPSQAMTLAQWFNAYDQIRHQAQMSPYERQHADGLLSRGFSVLMPGDEKVATSALLAAMVTRYQTACNQLRSLPQLNQTANLHHAYYDYFATAGQLFSDYVRVQKNLFVADAQTGQPLASSLIQRKQMLEGLEHQCKALDAQTRAQYGIAPYPW